MGMIRGRRFLELVLNNWVTTSNPFRMQGNFKSASVVLADCSEVHKGTMAGAYDNDSYGKVQHSCRKGST